MNLSEVFKELENDSSNKFVTYENDLGGKFKHVLFTSHDKNIYLETYYVLEDGFERKEGLNFVHLLKLYFKWERQ